MVMTRDRGEIMILTPADLEGAISERASQQDQTLDSLSDAMAHQQMLSISTTPMPLYSFDTKHFVSRHYTTPEQDQTYHVDTSSEDYHLTPKRITSTTKDDESKIARAKQARISFSNEQKVKVDTLYFAVTYLIGGVNYWMLNTKIHIPKYEREHDHE
ncbi:hypothetical protein HZB02_03010 [Candidatus Woesearchaeota archaeon]|nr:hypothetical protein [Candidatus Woesearchaeota archaeon]